MNSKIDDYDWKHIFENYTCATSVRGDRKTNHDYNREDVAEVIAVEDGENDGASWVGVFKMNDGKYMFVTAGCDYTGWGCQEGGHSSVAENLEDLISLGMTEGERGRLKGQMCDWVAS